MSFDGSVVPRIQGWRHGHPKGPQIWGCLIPHLQVQCFCLEREGRAGGSVSYATQAFPDSFPKTYNHCPDFARWPGNLKRNWREIGDRGFPPNLQEVWGVWKVERKVMELAGNLLPTCDYRESNDQVCPWRSQHSAPGFQDLAKISLPHGDVGGQRTIWLHGIIMPCTVRSRARLWFSASSLKRLAQDKHNFYSPPFISGKFPILSMICIPTLLPLPPSSIFLCDFLNQTISWRAYYIIWNLSNELFIPSTWDNATYCSVSLAKWDTSCQQADSKVDGYNMQTHKWDW